MSDLFQDIESVKSESIPKCCRNCHNLDWDVDYFDTTYHYCKKNVWFPTKKQTCKKQIPYPAMAEGGR